MLPEIIHAQQIVLLLKARGIDTIVISPGSRNAPLTIGFTNDPFFKCYSIVDERCASHVALGMAQQERRAVVLLCTSGSAVLNYYPAVAEAFYSEIPLIILSADRPPHKIDIGDGQTINQHEVYHNHIIMDATLKMIATASDRERLATNERIMNKALNLIQSHPGPVHLNVPFEEPLYGQVNEQDITVKVVTSNKIEKSTIPADFYETWESSSRKMVILSTLSPAIISNEEIGFLLDDPSVLVLSEVSSNITTPRLVWSIDTLIAPIEAQPEVIKDLRPTIVLTIGGMIVSKKIKQYLRDFETTFHYHIGNRRAYDTFFKLSGHYKMTPSGFLQQLGKRSTISTYQKFWTSIFESRLKKRTYYLNQIPWCDLKVFQLIFDSLPDNIVLQLGNSSTVRYAQLFKMNKSHKIFSNRGTSGIEGCSSTAIGAAMASTLQTILITGDISFFYDSNALWNYYIPSNFKILLINNSGGGIFRILPSNKEEENFHTFFETRHELDASHLCAMHGFGYHRVGDESAFAKAYSSFIHNDSKPQLLEIFTPTEVNDKVLLNYFEFIR
ncbi:MAG: 2-succinyl-5-enolpyruvyl-6-hydroxy-3-cyclohexene-1-carboxylic-acid synthase [Nonlabens sp.]